MLSAYHSERKPWEIKAVSLFVIFTFLMTQSDVQLGFAGGVVPGISVAAPTPDLNKSDKIHFMQQFDEEQQSLQDKTVENPLAGVTPDQNQQNPFVGDIPQGQIPQISTSFLTGQNPLLNKTDVGATAQEDSATHIVTVSYTDGTYFRYQKASNKIMEICDLTRPVLDDKGNITGYALETRQFSYETSSDNGTNVSYVRVITVGQGDQLSTYQKFTTLADGQLDELIETGYWILNDSTNQYVQSVSVRYDGDRVTLYDRTADPSYYIERTYEQLADGESRLLSYQKIEGALTSINIEIQYDDEGGLVTVIDRFEGGATTPGAVNFWEYSLTNRTERGGLLAVGEMDSTSDQVLSRMDITATTYKITYPQNATQLLVFERLANGGFGRVLRYRDTGIDLEYIYTADEATGAETMTVLNYTDNIFVKISFIEGMAPDASNGLIDSPQNILEAGTFTITGTTPQYTKLLEKASGGEWIVTDPNDGRVFDVYAAFPSEEWGGLIRSRGPPEEGSVILADYQYVYDTASRRVYAYDVTNLRYALYDWKDPQTPRLLEQGDIVLDKDGNVLSRAVTKTYDAEVLGAVSVPSTEYETSTAFASAKAALQLRPDVVASDIENLSIMTDSSDPGHLTVVLQYGATEYRYRYDIQANSSVLAKTRASNEDATFQVVEYSAQGRKTSESLEAADGTLTLQVTYRYAIEDDKTIAGDEVLVIDHKTYTFRVARLNADQTLGTTLRVGFYNDAKKIYSLQESGDTKAKWYTYGPESGDGIMLTEDDVATIRPVRGPQLGQASEGWRRPGGENTNVDELVRQLKAKFRTYEECAEERLRSGGSMAVACEEMLDDVSSLQKKIENEQYTGVGSPQFPGEGGNGTNDLNYHSPAPTPAYVTTMVGLGSAPVDNPSAQVVYTNDAKTTATISLNGLVQDWTAGIDGIFGSGDDEMSKVTETATKTTWYYTKGRAVRVTTVEGDVETELARYEYPASGTVNVIQADGARYEYSYTDEKDPFGSAELVRAKYEKDGQWVTQTYENGRLSSMCDGAGSNCTTYSYDTALNQAVLTSATGTRIVNLGGDGNLGTADDYLVGGTDTTLSVVKDVDQKLQSIEDLTNGTTTTFEYTGTQVAVATNWTSGGVINEVTVNLGADGVLGTSDDRLLYSSGIYNGELFAETFDENGHMLSWEGYVEVTRQDADGRLLRADGTAAMTEEEAAKDLVHQWITYSWTSVKTVGALSLPEDERGDGLDWTATVSTYQIEGTELILQSQSVYEAGTDDVLGTTDDILTYVQGYDAENKVHYEQTYDAQGRVLIYKNTDTGDELRYTYNDTAKTVTITSSGNYFMQVYKFDDDHPGDLSFARLIKEERDGIKRIWDENEQLVSAWPSRFVVGDIKLEELRESLADEGAANDIVLEALGITREQLGTVTREALVDALNSILAMADFYTKVDLDAYQANLPQNIQQLLRRIQGPDGTMTDDEQNQLNRALLEAIYPEGLVERMTQKLSGSYVTSVTSKEGVTTFFQDGVILSVVKRDGTVLRTYTHIVDPVTGELTDVNFEGKETLAKVSICLDGTASSCSSYRVIYENGTILEYQMKDNRPVLVWIGDSLGIEFTQTTDPKTGDLTIRYNDGRTSVYSQAAGFYEIQRSISLWGDVETYCYYGSTMAEACRNVDLAASQGKIQSAIDALPATGIDTGTAEFTAPDIQAGDPGLDFSVRADGSIAFYAPRDKTEWQEIPNVLFVISEFGHVTINQLEKTQITQMIEFRADGTLAGVTKNDADGRVVDTYRYDDGGRKILSHSIYTYYSTDKTDEDYRLLKLVETYNVADLNTRIIKDITARAGAVTQIGTLESRVHYLARHAEAQKGKNGESSVTEALLGRFDYLGLGLVDYTETYLKPLVPGGELRFLSSVQQQYVVFQLMRSVTYKNPTGGGACGAEFSGCEIVSYDDFTYIPGTMDVDFTSRYDVLENDINNAVLRSVFRTEQVDDRRTVTHDFGKDFQEDTEDDTFTVSTTHKLDNDLVGDTTREEWGIESFEYGVLPASYTHKGGYKEAYAAGAFSAPKSHTFQYDVYGDGSLTRTKSYRFIGGVETTEVTYSETRKLLGSEAGYEGTLRSTLLGDLSAAELENFKGQEFTFTKTWKFGFDKDEEDRVAKSESYSVTSRDEKITRSVSRDVIADILTYTEQLRINHASTDPDYVATRNAILGAGGLLETSDEDMFESRSWAGGFNTLDRFLLDHNFSVDIRGDGTLSRSKTLEVVNGDETGKISFSETKDVAHSTISYDGVNSIGTLLLGSLAGEANWEGEHISRTQTWTEGFDVSGARFFEGESYQLTSVDGKITRSANWDAVKGEVSYDYQEQIKVPYDTITVNGIHVGQSLLGDISGSSNWGSKSILYSTSSNESFNVADRFINSEYYQVTSRDRSQTRTMNIDRYHPDGPRVSYSTSTRATRQEIQDLLYNPDGTENASISMLPGEREMFMSVFNDPEFANNPFYLVTGSNDAFNVAGRYITSKAYQMTARDGDTTHSLMIDDRVPNGYPIVTYQRSERMRLADIASGDVQVFDRNTGTYALVHVKGLLDNLDDSTLTLVPPPNTILEGTTTLWDAIQSALRVNPYATFTMTSSSYVMKDGKAVATTVGYSWSSRDGNKSWNLSMNEDAPDGPELTFTQTQRVSHAAALVEAKKVADPVKKAEALAALRGDPLASIAMSTQGAGDPVYQWTSSANSNISYAISLNNSVPVGVDNAPTGTEVTFSKSTRVSRAKVLRNIALVTNETLRDQELERLNDNKNCVYFYEQQAGDDDPVYQWSALGEPNVSYTLTTNTHVPVGIPVNGIYPSHKTEASFSMNTRVSKAQALARIVSDAGGAWIANPEDQTAALQAYNAAVLERNAFYIIQSGIADPVLQWTVGSDPNTNYSLSINESWHSAIFNFNRRVSAEHVAEQYKDLPADDSRKVALEAAIAKGAKDNTFYMSMGDRGPMYQWTNKDDKNISYSLSLDTKFPVGTEGAFMVPPVVTFSTNTRASVEEAIDQCALIGDETKRLEAKTVLGWDEATQSLIPNGTAVFRAVSDGISAIDGIDPTYQFADMNDSNTSYTISVRTGVPTGDPSVNTGTEAIWGATTQVGRAEVAAWLNDHPEITLIAEGVTAAEALQHAESFYISKGSLTDEKQWQYQWMNFYDPNDPAADPNISYSLQVREDLKQKTLTKTTQVSAATVAAELAAAITAGTITVNDSRKLKIERALADGVTFSKTMGDKGPNYQWTSDSDKNMSYSLGVDTKFPIGEGATASFRTELSFTTSVRASLDEIKNKLGLIADEVDRNEALNRLNRGGVSVISSVTDGASAQDGVDPTYQFSDVGNSDVSYSIAIRSGVPVGLPDAQGLYSQFTSEATWNVSTRVSKAAVQAWLTAQGYFLINNGMDTAAAFADDAMYYLSQTGTNDEGQYQWTSTTDPNTSFSLQASTEFKQVTLTTTTQVSAETVQKELDDAVAAGTITAADTRKPAIENAIANGKVFYRSLGVKGPSYQWSSETDRNKSYSLGVDTKFPVGTGVAAGFRTELTFTTNDRVSIALAASEAEKIQENADIEEAQAKLAMPGIAVTRSVTDGVLDTDGIDPTYQFADPSDQNKSYSISIRSRVPEGNNPVTDTGIEATWSISERVSPASALAEIDALIAAETYPAAIAELNATKEALTQALAEGDAVYLVKAGSNDPDRQYQWTNKNDTNKSYSLTVKDRSLEAILTVTDQISMETVSDQLALLDQDLAARLQEIEIETALTVEERAAATLRLNSDYAAKRTLIVNAIADGKVFYRSQTGTDDPSYNWVSNSNVNINYNLNINSKVPVGLKNAEGNYTQFRTEISFTASERMSKEYMLAEILELMPTGNANDNKKKTEAEAAMKLAGTSFYRSITDGGDPSYQWTNPQDSDESWSLAVNTRVPQGTVASPLSSATEAILSHTVRKSRQEVASFIAQIKDPAKKADAEAALAAGAIFYLSQAGDDDKVYQWTNKDDSGISYSVTYSDHVPAGLPGVNGEYAQFTSEVIFSKNQRVSWQEMLTLIPKITDVTKKSEAYLALFEADSFSMSQAGNDDPVYQWTSTTDPNVSFSLSKNPRLDIVLFSRTQRVSREEVAAQYAYLNDPADPRYDANDTRYANLQTALADGRVFYLSQAGLDDTSYQWSSVSSKNLNYSMSVNTKVPVGEERADHTYASYRTEVTFTRNERASLDDAKAQAAKIRDTADQTEALAILNEQSETGLAVYRSLSDGESVLDYVDYSYQFTDMTNLDKSYSITVNSAAPDGPEATWNISTRVLRATVAQYVTNEYFAGDASDPKLLDALAALDDGDSFFLSRAGSNDPTQQYQWTSRTNSNINYSLNVKASWNEATFSRTRRVSVEDVVKQYAYLGDVNDPRYDARDTRYANLQAALADGKIFNVSQVGDDDPSYQWSSETDRNLSYSMSVNTKVPHGTTENPLPDGTEVTFTRNERVKLSEAQDKLLLAGDEDDRTEAAAALAQAGVMVYKSLSDGESVLDYVDPVYQFSDVTNPDKNYSLAIRSGIPVGIPSSEGVYPSTRTEANWSVSERISREQVRQHIEADATGEWITNSAKKAEALASLADSEAFYMSYGGTNDNVTYQWTSRANQNVSYSLLIKDKPNPVTGINWHEAVFSRNARVSKEEVAAQYAYLKDTGDSRYAGLKSLWQTEKYSICQKPAMTIRIISGRARRIVILVTVFL
ncbi:MAG: hypothetical protein WC331_07120 [Candidatus Omnitrophota bacterium]|jgi:hypothetical protein